MRKIVTPVPQKELDEVRRSPQGLITIKTGRYPLEGFRVEEIAPGQYAIKGLEARRQITERISSWREHAIDIIETSGKNLKECHEIAESDELDGAWAAARVLKRLNLIEYHLRWIERDLADQQEPIFGALLTTIQLATDVNFLGAIDEEKAIVARQASLAGALLGPQKKRKSADTGRETQRWHASI